MTTSFAPQQQRGGTLLGLIVGAVVGLGAALAVAVYVTKVPVPFLNKTQARGADNDAAEAKKNKDWDPNTPLAGKNGVKPAPGAVGAAAPANAAVATASITAAPTVTLPSPAALAASAAAAKAAAKPPVSSDPLGDLAKSRADAKAASKTDAKTDAKADTKPDTKSDNKLDAKTDGTAGSGVDPFSYFIQAGAYRTPEDAEQQRAKLLLLGFQAKVTEREQAGRTVYRVRVGPFDKKDEADKTKDKLDGNAVETALVRVQR